MAKDIYAYIDNTTVLVGICTTPPPHPTVEESDALRMAGTVVAKPAIISTSSAFERFTEENLDNREKLMETSEVGNHSNHNESGVMVMIRWSLYYAH